MINMTHSRMEHSGPYDVVHMDHKFILSLKSSTLKKKTEEKFEIWDIIDNLPKLHSLDASGTTTGANLKANKLITCSGKFGTFGRYKISFKVNRDD